MNRPAHAQRKPADGCRSALLSVVCQVMRPAVACNGKSPLSTYVYSQGRSSPRNPDIGHGHASAFPYSVRREHLVSHPFPDDHDRAGLGAVLFQTALWPQWAGALDKGLPVLGEDRKSTRL